MSEVHRPTDEPTDRQPGPLFDLPAKCLLNIFKYIPLQHLDDIIELCPEWDKLVQEHIPVEAHLTDEGFRIAMHFFQGYQDFAKYRIKVLHSRVFEEPVPDLKSPEDLRIVEFCTHTEVSLYSSLLSNASNVQELQFGPGSLSGRLLSCVDVHFPNLKVLRISDQPIDLKGTENPKTLPQNIVGFMRKTFPMLQELTVYSSANREQTTEYVQELLKFMQNHCATLRTIKFKVRTLSRQDAGDMSDIVELPVSDLNMKQWKEIKLDELELSFGSNCMIGLEHWTLIMNQQKTLAHLCMGLEKPLSPSFYLAPVTGSAATLVSLQLGVEVFADKTQQTRPIDCSIFESCLNLKMMVLTGPPNKTPNTRSPAPELLNLRKLPKSLCALAVDSIYLETSQLMELSSGVLRKERSLQRVCLRSIGVEGKYGMTLIMLDTLLSAQVLLEIIVKGVNGDDMRLHEFEHLIRLGVKSPLAKCSVHAYLYPNLQEYHKPTVGF